MSSKSEDSKCYDNEGPINMDNRMMSVRDPSLEKIHHSDSEDLLSQDYVDEQTWAAISFVVILIILGVPLWWKMTEVERSYFPYEDIANLRHRNLSFLVHINIYFWFAPGQKLQEDLHFEFTKSRLYVVNLQISKSQEFRAKSILELENMNEIHKQPPGNVQLIEVNSLKDGEVVMGRHRTAYFSRNIEANKIYQFLQRVLLHEEILLESVAAVISPGLLSENVYYLRKIRPSPKYDVIFTVVNPQPDKIQYDWNNEIVIEKYFQPVLKHLSFLSKFSTKSQWLYLIDLQQTPKRVKDYYTLNEKQIPHIITPLEKKIGSGVAQNPCINFVLYIPRCEHTPTFFIDGRGVRTNAVLSARWGGIQLVNANQTHCVASAPLLSNPEAIMRTFLFQFRSLLGLKDLSSTGLVLPPAEIICVWEEDVLYRMRILELFISSRITLTSLSQLLGEISNIVITDEVGNAVIKSLIAIENTLNSLRESDLTAALNTSTEAFIASEFAFTHPSLLALLYFPDDQKYAVYIPLYLPVMIPVVLSLRNIQTWLNKKIFSK